MEKPINEPFTSEESQEIYKNFKTIVNSRLDKLYNSKGSDGEQYAYSIAVKQMRNKQTNKPEESTIEKPMEDVKLKEMVRAALTEKPRPDYPDIDKDGDREESMEKAAQDKKKMQKEDLDLGHEDNEPHMLKADLYRIGKYAMELYKMVDQFEGEQEIDFPHWWQAKVIEAKNLLISAKHYLDFETKESQLDAMVNVASEEGAIDEEMTPQQSQKKGMPFKNVAEKEATKKKIKEAILAKLKQK
jgi:predicted  nucleic acid-binding Zn-ribbon protein